LPALFDHDDVTERIGQLLPEVPVIIANMHATLALAEAPPVRPGKHCDDPYECEFWGRCTATKPADWIINIPRLPAAMFNALDGAGIESMRDIPPNTKLTPAQRKVVDVAVAGREHVSPGLPQALVQISPPVGYLDFETFMPAIPLYRVTRPYQQIPFQWSLHHDDGRGVLVHHEFLADGEIDPRREFAETLLEAVERIEGPLAVYTSFEATALRKLAASYPDLDDRLNAVIARLVDLCAIVRDHVAHPGFAGSYSIKAVAPALAPHITYDDLDGVADGSEASAAFYWLVTDPIISAKDRIRYREALRAYCQRDTLAMVHVHRRLIAYTAG
jgi:predicted RecB family nuclease